MKIRLPLLVFFFFCAISLNAQTSGKSVRAGIEWGGSTLLLRSHHYNYITSDRYRVDDKSSYFAPCLNGYLYAHCGMNVNDNLSTSLYAGFSGLSQKEAMFPIFLRSAWYPNGVDSNGLYYFADIGSAICQYSFPILASVGLAHRMAIASWLDLDLLCGVRMLNCTPSIYDPDTGEEIIGENLRMSTSSYYSLYLGLSLSF